jgi:hypothetical protein
VLPSACYQHKRATKYVVIIILALLHTNDKLNKYLNADIIQSLLLEYLGKITLIYSDNNRKWSKSMSFILVKIFEKYNLTIHITGLPELC